MISKEDYKIPVAEFTSNLMNVVDNVKRIKKQLGKVIDDQVKTVSSCETLAKQEESLKAELKNAYATLNGVYGYTTKLCRDRLALTEGVEASEKEAVQAYLERAERVKVKYLSNMATEPAPGEEE